MPDSEESKSVKPYSWSLRDLKLPREEMIEAINGAVSVPTEAKAFLIAHVNLVPIEHRFLRLDAHCHCGKQMLLTASITPL